MRCLPRFPTCSLVVVCCATLGVRAQQDDGEFSARGSNVVRVESEAKLRVPRPLTEEVWVWLRDRYRDCSWLNRDGARFTAATGNEQFYDTYFDTPDFTMLTEQSGVRVRKRDVFEGAAMAKDNRQLLQMKLNRQDPTGLARSEIKFVLEPSPRSSEHGHPFLSLVSKDDLEGCKSRFQALGYDPYAFKRVLMVEQNRRRIYVSDQKGALATITLDVCQTREFGTRFDWTEIEVELNEIRYTEGDAKHRAWLESIGRDIQADIMGKYPAIEQDQTPKYNKAFAAIEAQSWMPVRWMVRQRLTATSALATIVVLVAGVVTFVWLFINARQRRRRRLAA